MSKAQNAVFVSFATVAYEFRQPYFSAWLNAVPQFVSLTHFAPEFLSLWHFATRILLVSPRSRTSPQEFRSHYGIAAFRTM